MAINTTPSIPTAVDELASMFCEKFAERIAPIQHYVGAMYGGSFSLLSSEQRMSVLTVVHHAVQYGDFDGHAAYLRRAAAEGMRLAQTMLFGESTPDAHRHIYAKFIGDMAKSIAETFPED